jgi:chemotaxis protein MotB
MARGHGRGRRGHAAEHDNDERWLLTYADMITLLMALFMVLFSISSVNISKYRTLQEALKAAFSGDILPGGKAIAQPGASANSSRIPTAIDTPAIVRLTTQVTSELEHASSGQASGTAASSAQSASASSSSAASVQVSASQQEQSSFEALQRELNAYAAKHGFGQSVHTAIEQRGLVIRVLTDSLLFPSGSATLETHGQPLLSEIAALLNVDHVHPIDVEGNTDNVPISGPFASNWELSTARASTVVRFLVGRGVDPQRLSATGYAEQRPIATNSTAAGRALNRRVEIVLQRLY